MEAIFLNSGGLDTFATAKLLSKRKHELHSIYIDFNQKNRVACLAASKKIAWWFCANHHVVTVAPLGELRMMNRDDPGIGFQGAVVHSLAASYARAKGIKFIVSATKADSQKSDFTQVFMDMLKCHTRAEPIALIRPLEKIKSTKDIVEIIGNDPRARETHSCRHNIPCGVCVKCKDRVKYGVDLV